MAIPINTIELYLASLPEAQQKALQKIRQLINKLVPEAEEIISYNMPAYRYHGMLVGFCPAGVSVACILNYKNVCTEPRHIKTLSTFLSRRWCFHQRPKRKPAYW